MLETRKSITLTGTSTIEKGTEEEKQTIIVAYMSASIAEDGTPNISKTIQDRETYLANKAAVKKDMDDFEEEAWALIQ